MQIFFMHIFYSFVQCFIMHFYVCAFFQKLFLTLFFSGFFFILPFRDLSIIIARHLVFRYCYICHSGVSPSLQVVTPVTQVFHRRFRPLHPSLKCFAAAFRLLHSSLKCFVVILGCYTRHSSVSSPLQAVTLVIQVFRSHFQAATLFTQVFRRHFRLLHSSLKCFAITLGCYLHFCFHLLVFGYFVFIALHQLLI